MTVKTSTTATDANVTGSKGLDAEQQARQQPTEGRGERKPDPDICCDHALSNQAAPLNVDVGAGLRLKLLGEGRTFRVDTAWGVRDGEFALSVGWALPWPGWR